MKPIVDGVGGLKLFQIYFPLLKPVTATIIIIQAVMIFNDFTHPLYFLPRLRERDCATGSLYNFTSQYVSQWNLLFTNALLDYDPATSLIFIFNKKI